MSYRPLAILVSSLLLTTTACQSIGSDSDSRYWQREKTSEAIYMRGPKAQQMLQRDIARCTSEIRELTRLGAIKSSFPPDPSQNGKLSGWETPERDGYLLVENGDYYGFEGCMTAKGWERTKFVDYDVVRQSRKDYVEAIEDSRYRSTHGGRPKSSARSSSGNTVSASDDRAPYND